MVLGCDGRWSGYTGSCQKLLWSKEVKWSHKKVFVELDKKTYGWKQQAYKELEYSNEIFEATVNYSGQPID